MIRWDASHPLAVDLEHVLAQTLPLWEDLRGRRLFLSGGTGFFGGWLLESYLWAWTRLDLGGEILVLTRDSGAFRQRAPHLADHPAVRLLTGDQVDFEFPAGPLHGVLHAAVAYGDPETVMASNLAGTARLLDLAAARGAGRFLFTSSGAVYGTQPLDLDLLPEASGRASDPAIPRSPYGEMKRLSEALGCAAGARDGFTFTIARCFAFAGPGLPLGGGMAYGNFIADALAGGPIRVTGDGTTLRSYLYAADLAVWLWWILLRGQGGRAYNVGSSEAHPLAEVARRVAAQVPGSEVHIALAPVPGRPPDRYVPSVARAREELGLAPLIGLDEGIRRTLAWHRLRGDFATN